MIVSQARQPREHRAEPVEQNKYGLNFTVRGKTQELHSFQSGCCLGCFSSGAPKAGKSVGPRSTRGFRDAEVCRKQCAA